MLEGRVPRVHGVVAPMVLKLTDINKSTTSFTASCTSIPRQIEAMQNR